MGIPFFRQIVTDDGISVEQPCSGLPIVFRSPWRAATMALVVSSFGTKGRCPLIQCVRKTVVKSTSVGWAAVSKKGRLRHTNIHSPKHSLCPEPSLIMLICFSKIKKKTADDLLFASLRDIGYSIHYLLLDVYFAILEYGCANRNSVK